MAEMKFVEAQREDVHVVFDGVLQVFSSNIVVECPPYETFDQCVRLAALYQFFQVLGYVAR